MRDLEIGTIYSPPYLPKYKFLLSIYRPILDVECVSVSQSLLQFPMDCLLLPGNNLLIVDSDAGLLLISLESKQVLKQISPKQNVWRNPECCCLGSGGNNNGEEQTIFVNFNFKVVDFAADNCLI